VAQDVQARRARSPEERGGTREHAKSRFMAAVGHDLRQPMHALALCIDELKSADLPGHAYPLLDHMESALHSTQSLLDSIRF